MVQMVKMSFVFLLSLTLSLTLLAQDTTELSGHTYEVHTVSFSRDGNLLVSGSGDTTAIIWDVQSKKPLFQINDHRRTVYAVAFSKLQNNLMATSSSDGHLILWDVNKRSKIATLVEGDTTSNGIMSLDFSPTENILAVAYMGGEIALWDTTTFKFLKATKAHPAGFAMSVRFSPDGERIVTTGGIDNSVRLFNSKDLSLRTIFTDYSNSKSNIQPIKELAARFDKDFNAEETEFYGTVWDAAFSPDGTRIAAVDTQGMLKVWSEDSARPIIKNRVNDFLALSVEYSHDGKNIFVGVDAFNSTVGNFVKMIDAQSGVIMKEVDVHQDRVRGLAISPDGNMLATASWDETVKLITLPFK